MSPSDFDDDWGYLRGNADAPEWEDVEIVNETTWGLLMLEFC